MSRCLLALFLCSCATAVPKGPMPITWTGGFRGHWVKGGAPIYGFECAGRFEDAVSGDSVAEAEMGRCTRMHGVASVFSASSLGVPTLGLLLGRATNDAQARTALLLGGLISGAIALILTGVTESFAADHRHEAIRHYNEAWLPAQLEGYGQPSQP